MPASAKRPSATTRSRAASAADCLSSNPGVGSRATGIRRDGVMMDTRGSWVSCGRMLMRPPPRSPEGMDHAPDRDSSKRPAEKGDVERGATSGQLLDGANAERDIWDAERGLLIERVLDAGSIRVDREYFSGGWRVLESEPAVAAADLED